MMKGTNSNYTKKVKRENKEAYSSTGDQFSVSNLGNAIPQQGAHSFVAEVCSNLFANNIIISYFRTNILYKRTYLLDKLV